MMTFDDLPLGTVLGNKYIKLDTREHYMFSMETVYGGGGMHGPKKFIPGNWRISFLPVEFVS